MEIPLTARNVVRVNAPFTRVGFYALEAFAGVKAEEKGAIQDSQVSNARVSLDYTLSQMYSI